MTWKTSATSVERLAMVAIAQTIVKKLMKQKTNYYGAFYNWNNSS
jgi:hypothetical protein